MNIEIQSSKINAAADLYVLVNSWLEEKPNRNISILSRVSGVSETSIRRIMNNKTFPTNDNLMKVLTAIFDEVRHKDILEKLPLSLSQYIKFNLPFFTFEGHDTRTNAYSLDNILSNSEMELIFIRCSISSGLKKTDMTEEFGTRGLNAVNELISLGLLSEDNGLLFSKHNNSTISTALSKRVAISCLTKFYREYAETNRFFAEFDSVSILGYGKVMDVIGEANKNILKIMRENPGNIPIVASGFVDKFTQKNVFNEEEDKI